MMGDRPYRGILLMLGFCVLAPMGDSIAKILGERLPLGQLLGVRFAVQALILLPIVLATGRSLTAPVRIMRLIVLRTFLHILGIGAMFLSLRYLPIADAVAIAFVMPFIMLILGKYLLHEAVGWHRLLACAVGFIGTLLVIQPNFAQVGAPALLPLLVAVDFALFMLVTRKIAKAVDPVALQATSGLIGTAFLLPVLAAGALLDWTPFDPITPSTFDWALLGLLGALGTFAHLLMTWALRFAPAATLAPMQYLEIPVATFFGWLIFQDLPNGIAAIGIAITIGAGLYIIARERRTAHS